MAEATTGSPAGSPASRTPDLAPPSLLDNLRELWAELPGLLNDRVELLSLELRRASGALVQILALVVAAAILGVTAWLVLWGAVVLLLVAAGLPLVLALAIVLFINVLACAWAVVRARRLLPLLRLPATQRHLMIKPAAKSKGAMPPDQRQELGEPLAS